jgi:hypothetical protein
MFGGETAVDGGNGEPTQATNETWTWDGHSWHLEHPALSPLARFDAGLVYDANHQVLVLYGGFSPTGGVGFLGDTWTWDGANWKQVAPAASPTTSYFDAPMTYDATRRAVLLFIGAGACICNPINETWSWDGTTWTKLAGVGDPGANQTNDATIGYHAASGLTYFVGLTGTWTLDPAAGWHNVSHAGPALANGPLIIGTNPFAMTDDAARGVLLVLGSQGDTWAWDGRAWAVLNPTSAPQARFGAAMVYDPLRKQVVLFGGSVKSPSWTVLGDAWIWDGTTWGQAA